MANHGKLLKTLKKGEKVLFWAGKWYMVQPQLDSAAPESYSARHS